MNVMREWRQPTGQALEVAHREHLARMRLLYPDLWEDEIALEEEEAVRRYGYAEPDAYEDEESSNADTEESGVDFEATCTNDEYCNHCSCYHCDFVDNVENDDFNLNEETDVEDEE